MGAFVRRLHAGMVQCAPDERGDRRLPVGLSFVGPAWSEARLLGLGYAYEQAAKVRLVPGMIPSIEEAPEILKYLQPAEK